MEPDYEALALELALAKLESESAELDSADTPALRNYIATLTARVEELQRDCGLTSDSLKMEREHYKKKLQAKDDRITTLEREVELNQFYTGAAVARAEAEEDAHEKTQQKVDELEREKEELREDKARLDWLQEEGRDVAFDMGAGGDFYWEIDGSAYHTSVLRNAIDAARIAQDRNTADAESPTTNHKSNSSSLVNAKEGE